MTGAVVSHVGVAGMTLGGGLGHLMRRHGFTADNLLAVDLVTADTDRVRVDAEREPELFWALRGGGGNFGIATAFDYRVHPVGPLVLGGPIYWPLEQAPTVLRLLREFAPDAPDELGMMLVAHRAPPVPFLPPEQLRGAGDRPLARVVRRHRRRAARRRSVAGGRHPVGRCRSSGPVPCHPDPPRRQRSAGHPGVLEVAPPQELSDAAIDQVAALVESATSPLSLVSGWAIGGAVSRVAPRPPRWATDRWASSCASSPVAARSIPTANATSPG